ncbi:MAG: hypothetical protein II153_03660 [Erysipelotrichaceae bacterium]|nr:hypothetical protein [Erysipelotrichaceae bacterium]MBQ5443757.1 hypothetical protein [Erysipelotrichaceae bacterium]
MFFRKKTIETIKYDETIRRPAIRSSICTGERVAGFENLETGKFEEIQLLQSERDLEQFKKRYGITGDIRTIY